MKIVGTMLIVVGLGLLLFIVYSFFKDSNRTLSPVPVDQGVKVIFVSPTP